MPARLDHNMGKLLILKIEELVSEIENDRQHQRGSPHRPACHHGAEDVDSRPFCNGGRHCCKNDDNCAKQPEAHQPQAFVFLGMIHLCLIHIAITPCEAGEADKEMLNGLALWIIKLLHCSFDMQYIRKS